MGNGNPMALTVLVVDPCTESTRQTARILRRFGCAVEVCPAAGKAPAAAAAHRADLAIVSAALPDASLDGVLASIKKARPATQIIVLTNADRVGALETRLGPACCGAAARPADPRELELLLRIAA